MYDGSGAGSGEGLLAYDEAFLYSENNENGIVSTTQLPSTNSAAWVIVTAMVAGILIGVCLCCLFCFARRLGRRRGQQGTYRPRDVEIRTIKELGNPPSLIPSWKIEGLI